MISNSLQAPLVGNRKPLSTKKNFTSRSVGIEASEENLAFFSIVSHNMKNPFASLLGFTDLLFDDFDELNDEERKFYLEEIKKSANSTFNYVENFFEWIYYKSGKMKFEFTYINLKECINNVLIKINQNDPEQKSIYMEVDDHIELRADKDSIEKVLFNLIENALKFSQPNPKVKIKAKIENGKIKIIISDNGIGIKREDLTKIFNIAKDPSTIGESSNKGTGMSLILTKELIERNNGTIHIESNFGEGSTFSIYLEEK